MIQKRVRRAKGVRAAGWWGNMWGKVKGWFGGHKDAAKAAAKRELAKLAKIAGAKAKELADRAVAAGKARVSHHYQKGKDYVNNKVQQAEAKANAVIAKVEPKKKHHGGSFVASKRGRAFYKRHGLRVTKGMSGGTSQWAP
jgi:hypothetical protein